MEAKLLSVDDEAYQGTARIRDVVQGFVLPCRMEEGLLSINGLKASPEEWLVAIYQITQTLNKNEK